MTKRRSKYKALHKSGGVLDRLAERNRDLRAPAFSALRTPQKSQKYIQNPGKTEKLKNPTPSQKPKNQHKESLVPKFRIKQTNGGKSDKAQKHITEPRNFHGISTTSKVIDLLRSGHYPAKISRILEIPRTTLHRILEELESEGYIKKKGKTHPQFYEVIRQNSDFAVGHGKTPKSRLFRTHNVEITYKILKSSPLPFDKRWTAKNTPVHYKKFGDASYKVMGDTLAIYPSEIVGESAKENERRAIVEAERIKDSLEARHGILCGKGHIARKFHHAVKNPVADLISTELQVTNEHGTIDRSETVEGEIDFFDGSYADEFLRSPQRMKEMLKMVGALTYGVGELAKASHFFATETRNEITDLEKLNYEMVEQVRNLAENVRDLADLMREMRRRETGGGAVP